MYLIVNVGIEDGVGIGVGVGLLVGVGAGVGVGVGVFNNSLPTFFAAVTHPAVIIIAINPIRTAMIIKTIPIHSQLILIIGNPSRQPVQEIPEWPLLQQNRSRKNFQKILDIMQFQQLSQSNKDVF